MPAEIRFKALDGLRAYAALQVVFYHYYCLTFRPGAWFKYTERLLVSWDGMNIFFTLSGYLIGGILLSARGREGMIKVFYARRFFRIVPLYLLLLATYWLVRLVDNHFRFGLIYGWYSDIPFWPHLVFTQNIWIVQHGVMGPLWLMVTWSLAVEQQFYLIVPWLVRWLRPASLVVVALVGMGVAAVRLLHPVGEWMRFNPSADWLLPDRLDTLGAGLLVAVLASVPRSRAWLQSHRRVLRWLTGTYLLALLGQHVIGPWFDIRILRPITALSYALVINLLAEDQPWPVLKPVLNWLAPLGALSYSMYLFHFPILFLTDTLIYPSELLALVLTIGFGGITYRYLERPLIERGHRYKYGETRKPAPVAAA